MIVGCLPVWRGPRDCISPCDSHRKSLGLFSLSVLLMQLLPQRFLQQGLSVGLCVACWATEHPEACFLGWEQRWVVSLPSLGVIVEGQGRGESWFRGSGSGSFAWLVVCGGWKVLVRLAVADQGTASWAFLGIFCFQKCNESLPSRRSLVLRCSGASLLGRLMSWAL